MNFLLRNQSNLSNQSEVPTAVDSIEKEYKILETSSSWPSGLSGLAGGEYGAGEDARGTAHFGIMRTRMPIEDHADVLPDEGSILIPFKALSDSWYAAEDMTSLSFLDRPFIFPGEQFHIIVHISAHSPSAHEIITPFKIAAAIQNRGAKLNVKAHDSGLSSTEGQPESLSGDFQDRGLSNTELAQSADGGARFPQYLKEKGFTTTQGGNLVATTAGLSSNEQLVQSEGHRKRNLMLLESFKNSHFFVRIGSKGVEHSGKQRSWEGLTHIGSSDEEESDGERNAGAHGCKPVVMEHGQFDPAAAGGVARAAIACRSLGNGDVAVVLQVTMASDLLSNDAELEVLQFEQYDTPSTSPADVKHQQHSSKSASRDPMEGLLQWLLPLDRPSSPPPLAPSPLPPLNSSPSPSRSGSSNSTFFSFSHHRSSSLGSALPSPAPTVIISAPPPAPTYGPEEWDRFALHRASKGEVGSEGLLSFRGAVLEPQRFSAHCGLQGPYVPGKRWKRKLAILQPIRLESYFANCNTQDLICVLVENILPATGVTANVVMYVDSVSIVCQSAAPGSPPLSAPIACVEVGEDHSLPGLALRVGEQHSFILRPINQAWEHFALEESRNPTRSRPPREAYLADGTGHSRKKATTEFSTTEYESGQYAVLVSCHCSHTDSWAVAGKQSIPLTIGPTSRRTNSKVPMHFQYIHIIEAELTESRLHFKHSLTWRPRPPRDLLLSVALENCNPTAVPSETLPQFTPQVVTVQATNLTSQEMNLTLLAPSSLATSPLSILSFPSSAVTTPLPGNSVDNRQSVTVREVLATKMEDNGAGSSEPASQVSTRRGALPPVRRMESLLGVNPTVLRERINTTADLVADNTPTCTHLWLQSTVPLGRVPPHSTTAVRCDLLPLTSGIITLDTLHIATKGHDALYIPENSLQVYCTSSIANGIS